MLFPWKDEFWKRRAAWRIVCAERVPKLPSHDRFNLRTWVRCYFDVTLLNPWIKTWIKPDNALQDQYVVSHFTFLIELNQSICDLTHSPQSWAFHTRLTLLFSSSWLRICSSMKALRLVLWYWRLSRFRIHVALVMLRSNRLQPNLCLKTLWPGSTLPLPRALWASL